MHSLYAEMGVKERGKTEKKTKTNEDRERLGISITQQEGGRKFLNFFS